MAIYKFPTDDDNKSKDTQEEKVEGRERKTPEFVVIEDEQQEKFQGGHPFGEEFKRISEIRVPLKLRLFCLLMGFLSMLVALGSLICYGVLSLSCLVTFYRVPTLITMANKFWKQLRRSSVFALGLILSVFSPYLGLGLVLMYFMMHNDTRDQGPMARMMRENLGDIFGPRL